MVTKKRWKLPKYVLKKTIIRALKTEPLQTGQFVEKPDLRKVGDCNVCAVGAVLRATGATNYQIAKHTGWANGGVCIFSCESQRRIIQLLERKDYMSALSSYFEDLVFGEPTKAQRRKLIAFVEKNFPNRVPLVAPKAQPLNSCVTDDSISSTHD